METTSAYDDAVGTDQRGLASSLLAPFHDAWLAARARVALLASLGFAAGEIGVEVWRANVLLTGDVATETLSDDAERAVRAIPGVCGVSNHLHVHVTRPSRSGGSDAEIRVAVTARLRHAPELRSSIIVVDNVYDGVVRLTGCAIDAATCARVFELAIEVPGVRRVINDVALQTDDADDTADDADAA